MSDPIKSDSPEGAVDLPRFVRLTDVLDAEEAAFVEKVLMNSGAELRREAWSEDGERALWKRPEEMKLISAVGNYAWIPTTRLVLCVEANTD